MKAIVFLAEGFEEVEAITVVDYLRRMDIEVDMVSITDKREVKGAHEVCVYADKIIDDLSVDEYSAVIIPGGMPGASNLRDEKKVTDIVKKMNDDEKLVAAICAGPIVLEKAGVIDKKNVTSFPGFGEQLKSANYSERRVVRDSNIITSRGPSIAVDFAIEIVNYLLGNEASDKLKEDILYDY